ncbi:MAG: hypothetical protein HQL86_03420 [Magnetococcales bacterium]|nr:hypothetical protein [Magnetococcales bacterium]
MSFLLVKNRGFGRFISQGFDFDFSALFKKKAFFAPFAKNALRAAFVGVVSVFWKRLPHLARGLLENDVSRDGCGLGVSFNERFCHVFCEKNFRASLGCEIVLRLWQNDLADMAQENRPPHAVMLPRTMYPGRFQKTETTRGTYKCALARFFARDVKNRLCAMRVEIKINNKTNKIKN